MANFHTMEQPDQTAIRNIMVRGHVDLPLQSERLTVKSYMWQWLNLGLFKDGTHSITLGELFSVAQFQIEVEFMF